MGIVYRDGGREGSRGLVGEGVSPLDLRVLGLPLSSKIDRGAEPILVVAVVVVSVRNLSGGRGHVAADGGGDFWWLSAATNWRQCGLRFVVVAFYSEHGWD